MKKVTLVFSLLLSIVFLSCKQNKPQSTSEVQWSENQKDSVVYVNHQNSDGSFSNFYMNYLLYQNLFRSGGYGAVNNYYQSNPSEFSNQSRYSSYKDRSVLKSEKSNINTPVSYSSPSRSYSAPTEIKTKTKSYSYPSRSYSSPSRSYSSPSRSYSSPSRSYSSPSRSYSSPSRSYSSPSRSYSSPSRR